MSRVLLAVWLTLAGCAHYVVNDPLPAVRTGPVYRFNETETGQNTNSLFICLVFSGGGTRAAALSYGVLEMLRVTRIVWKGVEKSLLDEVDCISSISGGSFTAAYYGLFRERIFTDFRPRFIDMDVEKALVQRVANPVNWFRLGSPCFSRIDRRHDQQEGEPARPERGGREDRDDRDGQLQRRDHRGDERAA